MRKPTHHPPPEQYTPSYAELGIVAEAGCLIEVRAPDADDMRTRWPRIWLTPDAATQLLEWLPRAIEVQMEPDALVIADPKGQAHDS
jgi:hypothetical protein